MKVIKPEIWVICSAASTSHNPHDLFLLNSGTFPHSSILTIDLWSKQSPTSAPGRDSTVQSELSRPVAAPTLPTPTKASDRSQPQLSFSHQPPSEWVVRESTHSSHPANFSSRGLACHMTEELHTEIFLCGEASWRFRWGFDQQECVFSCQCPTFTPTLND